MTRFFAFTAVALLAAPLYAADPKPTPILGIGIVSADRKLIFLPAKSGGIEAVDLSTGKPVWTNKDAAKLAGASDKVVVAWTNDPKKGNAFRVVAVDAATGKTLAKSDAIVMPDWATTTKSYGHSFRTAAKVEAEAVVVMWQAGTHYAGGAAPTPEIQAAARRNETGIASVDLKTGKVTNAKEKEKLKDDDFKAGPAGGFDNKLGNFEFEAIEMLPGFKPGTPQVTKVTFTVTQDKKELWKRELAGNPWSPPPP